MSINNYDKEGRAGEEAFRDWLDKEKIGYLYIDQTPAFFSPTFKDKLKRPDFLLLIPNIGFIAIDVKHYSTYDNKKSFTLNIDTELDKAVGLENISRTPLWYAYKKQDDPLDKSWYLINPLNILKQYTKIDTNKDDGSEYFVIPLDKFKKVIKEEDLSRSLLSFKQNDGETNLKKAVEDFRREQLQEELIA